MTKRKIAAVIFVCVFGLVCICGQEENARLDALKTYILQKDYPEVFKDTSYKTRILGFVDADVDNDGAKEIVVLFNPHYRQSAPILIYKFAKDGKVQRVTEGLAPGPLQKLSDEYLDSHALGMAVDFEIHSNTTPESLLRVVRDSGMGGLVMYDSFNHMDGRRGSPYFVDMRGVKIPSKLHDCSEFEFAHVKQIAIGGVREDTSKKYLAAWVGDEVYVYLIQGVSVEGLLHKKLWVLKAPAGFNGFESPNTLAYKIAGASFVLSLK